MPDEVTHDLLHSLKEKADSLTNGNRGDAGVMSEVLRDIAHVSVGTYLATKRTKEELDTVTNQVRDLNKNGCKRRAKFNWPQFAAFLTIWITVMGFICHLIWG